MEYACVIVYLIFSLLELVICFYTMLFISERQGAVFFLRNTKLAISNPKEKIKTSQEIEQELYYKFPYLQKKIENLKNNNTHFKNN